MKKKQSKKILKQLKKWLKTEIQISKRDADNGCFPHDSLKEEVRAKTQHLTLVLVANKLKELITADPF